VYNSKDIILNDFTDSVNKRETKKRILGLQLEYLKDLFYYVDDCNDFRLMAATMHFVTEWGYDPKDLPINLRERVKEYHDSRKECERVREGFCDDWAKYWDQLDEQVNSQ